MSSTFATHLFGSISGYATLAKSADISQLEDEALSGLGFGQTSDSSFIDSLVTSPSAYGRVLPSGRYAVTRCFPGAPDDVGRSTLLLASVVMTMHEWMNDVRGNLKAFLLDSTVWGLEKFHSGESVISKSFGGQLKPNADDMYLVDYLIKISKGDQNPVVILPSGQSSVDAILHLAGALSPEDALEYRWGIRMLSTTVPVDMMTLIGQPSTGGRRRIVQCEIMHEFFYAATAFFGEQRASLPAIPPIEALASDTFVSDLQESNSKPKVSKKAIWLVCSTIFLIVLVIFAVFYISSGSKQETLEQHDLPIEKSIGVDSGATPLHAVPEDNCPDDPNKLEPGICGCGTPDTDTDEDGTPDCNDNCPDDPNKQEPGDCGCGTPDTDTDGDGTPDCNDNCPDDPNKLEPGECGCENEDTDTDGDGVADCADGCQDDPNKTKPGICGCGTPDTDTDGDGTPDCNDNCPDDPNKQEPGECDCGTPDTDADGDGTPDCNDNCPDDPNKQEPGICGCGTPDTDADGDGTPDCNDNCPDDPNKQEPGVCGCGTPDDTDTDGDGTPDCNDNDDDNDYLFDEVDDDQFAPNKPDKYLGKKVYQYVTEDKGEELPIWQDDYKTFDEALNEYINALKSGKKVDKAKLAAKDSNTAFVSEYLETFLKKSNELHKNLYKIFEDQSNKFAQKHSELDLIQLITLIEAVQIKYDDVDGINKYFKRLKKFQIQLKNGNGNGSDYSTAKTLTKSWISNFFKLDLKEIEIGTEEKPRTSKVFDTTLNGFLKDRLQSLRALQKKDREEN